MTPFQQALQKRNATPAEAPTGAKSATALTPFQQALAERAKPTPTVTPPAEDSGNFLTDAYGGAAASVGAAATALGLDETAKAANEVAAQNSPRVGSYRDIRTDSIGNFTSDAASYVGSGIAQSAPEMAALAIPAAVGAVVGAPVTIGVGGALALGTLFNTGRNLQRQEQEGVDEDRWAATATGFGQSLLDRVVPGRVGNRVASAFSTRVAGGG
jgi:hypothetical protein